MLFLFGDSNIKRTWLKIFAGISIFKADEAFMTSSNAKWYHYSYFHQDFEVICIA